MTTTIQLIDATVKYAAQAPREYDHGPRINVVCTLSNGAEEKIWGKPDDAIAQLKRGQQVQLIRAGKSFKLAEALSSDASQPTVQQLPQETHDAPSSNEYADRLGLAINQYEQAWQAASALLKRRLGQPPEAVPNGPQLIQAIAADLFQQSLSTSDT